MPSDFENSVKEFMSSQKNFIASTTRKRAIDGNDTNGAPDMWCAITIY